MTEQRKHLLKMVGIMIYIMVLPILFFTYIGDNPNRVTEQMTREIAIVNEDTGAEQDGLSFKFGQEVSALINENSNYNWTVVGRSAAESGLEERAYDAVLYVPSDFSEHVLKFRDRSPSKASIEFELQPQLNAKNSERVQRELEMARNEINGEMSTIYWSYIGQEIDHVKVAFTEILNKEIAFQNAMNSFYSSGSQTLAEDIEDQSGLLAQLKSSIEEGSDGAEERVQTVEEADQYLEGFLEDVDAYREYQQEQQALLNETYAESKRLIEDSSAALAAEQNQAMLSYGEQQEAVLNNVNGIQEQIDVTSELANQLSDQREGAMGQQIQELYELQEVLLETYKQDLYVTSLDQIQNVLIPLRNGLVAGGAPVEEVPGGGEEIVEEAILDSIEEERAGLLETVTKVGEVQETISAVPVEQLPEGEGIVAALGEVTSSLQAIDAGLEEKQQSDLEWQTLYNQLVEQLQSTEPEIPQEDESFKETLQAIEAEIVGSDVLSSSRKSALGAAFNQELNEKEGSALITYARVLGEYGQLVKELEKTDDPVADELLANEELLLNYQRILAVDSREQQAWDQLSGSMAVAEDEVNNFSAQTEGLMDNYDSIINEQQGIILTELDTIIASTENLASTLTQTNSNEAEESSALVNGSQAAQLQQQVGGELTALNGLMKSLSERQDGVINYTAELQTEVDRVQQESNALNQNWGENILFTENVAADLNEIFDNARVDGQANGYIYDFLSNPVNISGEVLEEETVNLPPVVMLVILLASALLIGFFTNHFALSPWFVQLSLFGLLNLVVGLMISIFGLTIYPLANDQAIMWSVYTVLLLMAASGLVFAAFSFGSSVGWIVTVILMLLFIAPLLDLILPNFSFDDPITRVYLSIQYGTQSLFPMAVITLSSIIVVLSLVLLAKNWFKTKETAEDEAA
ncbi:type VII secretion protein EsaA [Jeotgalibacillus sp. S-D1]|uniref:type VII secretion protein EsaA n=1 Tax=Jeotgalibacillus sp. S-D1 TaxID=2552189 RepID=UPI001059C228|nr:type VII secretion protein EsaA [Jeotgalibacillus sp. S-D1]TDL31373.1 type VII secretion protein EsaA [Jeotgalibacillus sp. S-D1]